MITIIKIFRKFVFNIEPNKRIYTRNHSEFLTNFLGWKKEANATVIFVLHCELLVLIMNTREVKYPRQENFDLSLKKLELCVFVDSIRISNRLSTKKSTNFQFRKTQRNILSNRSIDG